MKIRVTILTENDVVNRVPKERMETLAKRAWRVVLDSVCAGSDTNDKAIVESCELVEG